MEEGLARINNALKPLPPQEPLPELSPEERAEDDEKLTDFDRSRAREKCSHRSQHQPQRATIIENLVSDNPLREGDSGSTGKKLPELEGGYDIGPNGAADIAAISSSC